MFKKLMSISMAVVLLLTTAAYFADSAEARGQRRRMREKAREQVASEVYRQRVDRERVTASVYGTVYQRRDGRDRVADAVYGAVYSQRQLARMRVEQIRQNQRLIKELNRTVKQKMKLVRELIKELREDPQSFPEEKAAAVREQLRLIRENRAQFGDTLGEIREERALLKENRKKQDGRGMRGNYDNVFAVQEARIRILREMIADIDELLALLRG